MRIELTKLTTILIQVEICGHATLAASHTLFSFGLVDSNATVEFVTLSGSLTAKKISIMTNDFKNLQNDEAKDAFYIELNFPIDPVTEFKFDDTSLVSGALKGASIIDIKSTLIQDDILVIPIIHYLLFYYSLCLILNVV